MIATVEHALGVRDFSHRPGTLSVNIETDVEIEPDALVSLAIDLKELQDLHPRLADARWLDEPAKIGSRAQVVVTMPASLNVLRPIIGATRGVFTLVEYEPERAVRYMIDFPRMTGDVQLVVDESRTRRSVEVRGTLQAKARLAHLASVPLTGVAELVIARAARRALARAVDALRTRKVQDMTSGLS